VSPKIDMPITAVRTHAGSVDATSDTIETGRSAAAQVQLGGEAYGILCQFLPGLINPLGDKAVDAMTESHTALQSTADKLRKASGASDSTDHASEQRNRHIHRPKLRLPL
jgi:hypothetical protein